MQCSFLKWNSIVTVFTSPSNYKSCVLRTSCFYWTEECDALRDICHMQTANKEDWLTCGRMFICNFHCLVLRMYIIQRVFLPTAWVIFYCIALPNDLRTCFLGLACVWKKRIEIPWCVRCFKARDFNYSYNDARWIQTVVPADRWQINAAPGWHLRLHIVNKTSFSQVMIYCRFVRKMQ